MSSRRESGWIAYGNTKSGPKDLERQELTLTRPGLGYHTHILWLSDPHGQNFDFMQLNLSLFLLFPKDLNQTQKRHLTLRKSTQYSFVLVLSSYICFIFTLRCLKLKMMQKFGGFYFFLQVPIQVSSTPCIKNSSPVKYSFNHRINILCMCLFLDFLFYSILMSVLVLALAVSSS